MIELNGGSKVSSVVIIFAAIVVAGAVIYGSITVNRVLAFVQGGGDGSPVVNPTPVQVLNAASPLAADPTHSVASGAIATVVNEQPIADEVRDVCWGMAVVLDRSRSQELTPQDLTKAVNLAGRIQFGGRTEFPPAVGTTIDAELMKALGNEPTGFDTERRNKAIQVFRALAWGAEQAYEGE